MDANEQTDGGRPKIALLKTTGDLAYDDEELNDGGTKYEEDLKDDGRTAPTVWAENPPQVSTALFGSTEVFGSTTGGKNQKKTRQGRSAANFFLRTAAGVPRGHQFEKEAEAHGVPTRGRQIYKEAGAHDVRRSSGESDKDSAPLEWVVEADQKAMRALADNRSFRGTSASRMA